MDTAAQACRYSYLQLPTLSSDQQAEFTPSSESRAEDRRVLIQVAAVT